jgi:hypothetical protein
MPKSINDLKAIEIGVYAEKTKVRFLFQFDEQGEQPSIELVLRAEEAMSLMVALQQLQVKYKIPIPAALRPQGSPTLTIVSN